jgi:hypothetical protein
VSAMFLAIRDHFALLLPDAGIHPTRQAMAVSTPHTCSMTELASGCYMVFSYCSPRGSVRFDQSFQNSGVGTLAMVRVTTTVLSYAIHQSRTRSTSFNSLSGLPVYNLGTDHT